IDAVREKSKTLTDLVVRAWREELAPHGMRLLSPEDAAARGGHVTIGHPDSAEITQVLWADGVIPDFRFPDGIRLGLSPLSTSHSEALSGVLAVRDALDPSTGSGIDRLRDRYRVSRRPSGGTP